MATIRILKLNNFMEIAALIIACVSLLFAVFTFVFYDRKLKKQDSILKDYELKNMHEKEEESKKAQVKANIIKSDKGKRNIKIFNAGKAVARNIRLDFDPPNDFSFINDKEKFPFEFMNPQDGTDYAFQLVMEYPRTIKIKLTWDDSFGKDREYEQILTL